MPGLRSELCHWTVLKTWPRSMASLGFAFITSQVTINRLESTQQGQSRSLIIRVHYIRHTMVVNFFNLLKVKIFSVPKVTQVSPNCHQSARSVSSRHWSFCNGPGLLCKSVLCTVSRCVHLLSAPLLYLLLRIENFSPSRILMHYLSILDGQRVLLADS